MFLTLHLENIVNYKLNLWFNYYLLLKSKYMLSLPDLGGPNGAHAPGF